MPAVTAPVFTYWDDDDLDVIGPQVDAARAIFPDYFVVTREAARALLSERSPQYLEAFDRIAIAACRSDIARLLALDHHGGLYIDAHCRIDDVSGVMRQMARLEQNDIVVSTRYAPSFRQIMPYNGIIWSRAGRSVVSQLLDQALNSLWLKFERESAVGFEPYHIWNLTGPGVFWHTLFDTEDSKGRLLPGWRERVVTLFESDSPIARHAFMGYRAPGRHWSERQSSELLFG